MKARKKKKKTGAKEEEEGILPAREMKALRNEKERRCACLRVRALGTEERREPMRETRREDEEEICIT